MTRPVLDQAHVHPAARARVGGKHLDLVAEVQRAVAENDVVVVGMSQNPHPRHAVTLLKQKGIAHKYLEYGSYLSRWRERLGLKMWSGWATFPMIFVKGVLVGGAADLKKLDESGELQQMLAKGRPPESVVARA